MMAPIIKIDALYKEFDFKKGKEKKKILAVNNVSFEVERGDTIALIGPNGAGKSTTIKIMVGILHPTSGGVSVCGLNPAQQRKQLSYKIGSVFGQRSQLSYHLPARASFDLFQKVYEISDSEYKDRLANLVSIFEVDEFIDQPVRKLSLGQRMRCEVIASLLHRPEIVFLDEPTIGLDVVAKRNLRDILKNLNKEWQTTVFLTSHDTGDIEALCDKTMIINNGQMIYNGSTKALKQEHIEEKRVYVRFDKKVDYEAPVGVTIVKNNALELDVKVDTKVLQIKSFLEQIVSQYSVIDINIEDPSLEEVISNIYEESKNGIE